MVQNPKRNPEGNPKRNPEENPKRNPEENPKRNPEENIEYYYYISLKKISDYARYDMTLMPKNSQKYFDLIDKLHDKYESYIGDDDDDVMRLLICLIIEVQEKNNDRLKSLEARVYSLEMLELNKNRKKTTGCCVIC